jgi:hypothetical protein
MLLVSTVTAASIMIFRKSSDAIVVQVESALDLMTWSSRCLLDAIYRRVCEQHLSGKRAAVKIRVFAANII